MTTLLTCPPSSPTATTARNDICLPPLTTFVTRLTCTFGMQYLTARQCVQTIQPAFTRDICCYLQHSFLKAVCVSEWAVVLRLLITLASPGSGGIIIAVVVVVVVDSDIIQGIVYFSIKFNVAAKVDLFLSVCSPQDIYRLVKFVVKLILCILVCCSD